MDDDIANVDPELEEDENEPEEEVAPETGEYNDDSSMI